jgi:hypothetical protein
MWAETYWESNIKNICLCDGNRSIFICKKYKQDATMQDTDVHTHTCTG